MNKIRARLFPNLNTLVLILAITVLGGCGASDTDMSVLAGSELKDLEPYLDQIAKNTGVRLRMKYSGTLDGAEKLAMGEPVDIAWFSHGKYISLLQAQQKRIVAQEKIMLSPVILGVKMSKAKAWGWVANQNLTWRDIAAKSNSGELRYAMTNPASSNSGFTALVGVTSAFSGGGDAVSKDEVDAKTLKAFFKGQKLTAGSSGWLAEAFVKDQDRLDGIINYESVLMQVNASGKLREPLFLVYPKEGIITADYPIMLLNKAKREPYDKLVAYLLSAEFQTLLMNRTQRRPATTKVKPGPQFGSQLLIELPFPGTLETINQILFAYLDEHRRPSHALFVLDVSGSMKGDRMQSLKRALNNLTGVDRSVTGQFARFRNREKITFITFNDRIKDVKEFTVTKSGEDSESMRAIRQYVDGLRAGGGTAIFDALDNAYTLVDKSIKRDPDRFYSVVLMSDGQNNDGRSRTAFTRGFRAFSEDAQQIKTFTILFGGADVDDMNTVAELTGGRVFDGRKSLAGVFKKIRGYQ